MALTFTIDAVNRTANVYRTPGGSLRWSWALGSDFVAEFPLYDLNSTSGAYRPTLGDEVTIADGATTIFHGRIERIRDAPVAGTGTGTLSQVTAKALSAVVDQVTANKNYAGVGDLTIANSSIANPTSVTTTQPHGLVTNDRIRIVGHEGSSPTLDGVHAVTVTGHSTFTIPVNNTAAGGGGVIRRVYTLKALVSDLRTTYLNAYGITLDAAMADGPDLEAPTFKDATLREVFNHFSTLTGYLWRITPADELQFYAVGTKTAGFSLTAANALSLGPVTFEQSQERYVNRVRLRFGSEAVVAKTQYITGDGTTTVWALDYTPAVDVDGVIISQGYVADTGVISPLGLLSDVVSSSVANPSVITTTQPHGFTAGASVSVVIQSHTGSTPSINGTHTATITGLRTFTIPVNVTVAGTGGSVYQSGLVWLYYPTTNSLFRVGALTSEYLAEFAYSAQFPGLVTASDSAEITANGLYEAVFDAPDIFDVEQAQDLADGLLRRYLETPKIVTIATRNGVVLPGDQITLTFANRTISGAHIVTQVQAVDATLDGTMEYTLTCMAGTEIHETYTDQLRGALGGVGGARQARGLITGGLVPGPSGIFTGPIKGNRLDLERLGSVVIALRVKEDPDPDPTEIRTIDIRAAASTFDILDITRTDVDSEVGFDILNYNRSTGVGYFARQGVWNAVTFAAGNFSGNGGMTVTVASGDVSVNRYTRWGDTITWQLNVGTFTCATSDGNVTLTMPGGFTAANTATVGLAAYADNGGTWGVALIQTTASSATVIVVPLPSFTWSGTGTDNNYFNFSVDIEIQP